MSRLITFSLSRPDKTQVVDQPQNQRATNKSKHQTGRNIPASCPFRVLHLFFIHYKKKSSFVAVLYIKTLVKKITRPFLDLPERRTLLTNPRVELEHLTHKEHRSECFAIFYSIVNSLDPNWTALERELRFRTP